MANHTRNLFIPRVDANTIRKALGETVAEDAGFDWTRIDKSTIFDLAFNPQEETSGYIDEANDTTYVKSYQPELPQEIILDSSNKLYRIMRPFCMSMPTGGDAVVPVILQVPDMDTDQPTEAYMWASALISPTDLNTVDGKLSFSLKLNGDAQKGTVAIGDDGAVTFTASTGAEAQVLRFSEPASTSKSSKNTSND